jgi:hypothetical protein
MERKKQKTKLHLRTAINKISSQSWFIELKPRTQQTTLILITLLWKQDKSITQLYNEIQENYLRIEILDVLTLLRKKGIVGIESPGILNKLKKEAVKSLE